MSVSSVGAGVDVETGPGAGWRAVQRIVLPADRDLDVLPLYVARDPAAVESALHVEDVVDRRSMVVRPGERVSLGAYFNAFPASYWRRWTICDSVRLVVRTSGPGTVIVYKSNARGARQRVEARSVQGSAETVVDLKLAPFGDGGWYWFDLAAGTEQLRLEDAEWQVPDEAPHRGTVSVAITTFNRPDYCGDVLRAIAADAGVRAVLDEVIVVDQGDKRVKDAPGHDAVAADLGDQLRIVHQGNIGGSGGFSRGMYETVKAGRSDYVLLLDDDIVLETEGVLRQVAFSDFCRRPTIVGGHMFDMYNKSTLHTFGEIVSPWRFQPAPAHPDQELGHSFAEENLQETPWLHRRADVDYNGWWMCMIPTSVVRELGLSLPVFIKWDDSEYGLRAKEAGYPTVTLPGSAAWHVSWIDKDDLVGWQAYFHERNRVIVALLHSKYPRGGRVLRESSYLDVKHLISMQYYTEAGRIQAMKDVLAGPEALHGLIGTKLGEIRAMAKGFTDAAFSSDVESFPAPRRRRPPKRGMEVTAPSRLTLVPWALRTVVRQLAKPVPAAAADHPEALVAHQDNTFYRMSLYDSAIVSNAEGTAASWYRRDPRQLRAMLSEGLALHARLLAEWPVLSKRYRSALSELTSFEAWERTFEEHDRPELNS